MLGSSRSWTATAWAVASSALSRVAPSAACLARQVAVGDACLLGEAMQPGSWRQTCPHVAFLRLLVVTSVPRLPKFSPVLAQGWGEAEVHHATCPCIYILSAEETHYVAHLLHNSPKSSLPDQLFSRAGGGSCLPRICPAVGQWHCLQVQLPFGSQTQATCLPALHVQRRRAAACGDLLTCASECAQCPAGAAAVPAVLAPGVAGPGHHHRAVHGQRVGCHHLRDHLQQDEADQDCRAGQDGPAAGKRSGMLPCDSALY